jgi:hypothetical protein
MNTFIKILALTGLISYAVYNSENEKIGSIEKTDFKNLKEFVG